VGHKKSENFLTLAKEHGDALRKVWRTEARITGRRGVGPVIGKVLKDFL
jgi:hypothetical protein